MRCRDLCEAGNARLEFAQLGIGWDRTVSPVDTTGMRCAAALFVLVATVCLAWADEPQRGALPWAPPAPRVLSDEDAASINIKELLSLLEAERKALEQDNEKALRDLSQGIRVDPTGNILLKIRVKEMLGRLKQGPAITQP